MRIYVIRHGETSWNVQRKLQGHKGADLDEKGVRLAEITAEALKDVPFAVCYTSPLLRARHTAEILLRGRNIPVIEDPRIQEISFGEWEGLCCAPGRMEMPEEKFQKFYDSPFEFGAPPGGESIRDVCARTADFYQELIHNREYRDKTVLVSTHGCACRAFLNNVYENRQDFWHGGVPMNCAVNIVDVANGTGRLTAEDQIYYSKEDCVNFFQSPKKKDNNENK
ncbi:MAG TPA: histidine phosphatase family protein [Candidatus Scatomonas pullistercoris]|uniref:phosphoglycerate mutase (2,3-diphosphoglycerate-dependent) n=1 Tax=Candidatus Scatomonas pullistercoris TaxID=2840920 RepID=A0A9D1P4R9_9FIRM|nr:histidine phosphatase family protein [Candidatus Scatomonas pullistercoris]